MMGRSSTRWFVCSVLIMASCFLPMMARADFVLKPSGQNAIPLRRKTLDIDATIRGGVASTTQTMTFANETQQRTEADFILTAPKGAIVTGFAYWYETEKVVARIVEKERAAQIYQHITSRMRDPALVEMIGKNTFRARIFPIMPNSDLRVEIKMVQPLTSIQSSTRSGQTLHLELAPVKAGTGTLQKFDLRVRVARDAFNKSVLKTINSWNLPVVSQNGSDEIVLQRRNFRAAKNLDVTLLQAPRDVSAQVAVSRVGKSDGYFALTLTSRQTLRQPRFQIGGVKIYRVYVPTLSTWKAGDSWIVVGRFRGGGNAKIVVSTRGRNLTTSVFFPTSVEGELAAEKLWATSFIASLSRARSTERMRQTIVTSSTRYSLPSKYTSWLAIPEAERVRYKTEKAQADFDIYGRQAVRAISARRANVAQTKELRARFEKSAQAVGREPKSEWVLLLGLAIAPLQQKINAENLKTRPRRAIVKSLRREIAALERAGGINPFSSPEQAFGVDQELVKLRRSVASETRRGRGKSRRVVRQRRRIAQLSQRLETLADAPASPTQQIGSGGFRTGDPLIAVDAPFDATAVSALLPDGTVKKLLWNATNRKWEARFDIPTYFVAREYSITVIVVLKSGARTQWTLKYAVDMTAPQGRGTTQIVGGDARTLRLEMQTGSDTIRVAALLPWGEKIDLTRSTRHAHRFFALATWPQNTSAKAAAKVTYILTDRAHNRTEITVDNTIDVDNTVVNSDSAPKNAVAEAR